MDSKKEHYDQLLRALLPAELFDYFEITFVQTGEKALDVYLDELNRAPVAYTGERLASKGFASFLKDVFGFVPDQQQKP